MTWPAWRLVLSADVYRCIDINPLAAQPCLAIARVSPAIV